MAAAGFISALVLSSCGTVGRSIRFGTAGIGGNYYAFGQALADVLASENESQKVEVKETAGSAANLRLLSGKYIQMAVAQEDMIHDAWNGSGIFTEKGEQRGYAAVAGLYAEACQIVTAEKSGIDSIRDLRGKKVCIGEEDSGTAQNAKQILLSYGLNEDMTEMICMNYKEAAEALKNGEIDAFFCTAGVRTEAVNELAGQMSVRLLGIDKEQQESLTGTYDYYLPYVIPAGTYNGQDQKIETIGVRSVLLAGDSLSPDLVRQITETLFAHSEELQMAVPADFELSPKAAAEGIDIPFHKGAADYYSSLGISVGSN